MNTIKFPVLVLASAATLVACSGSSNSTAVATTPSSSGGISVSDIQGPGSSSPLDGQVVSFSAIVTGDFQDDDADVTRNLGGFYVQQETPDANSASSGGIFVFDGSSPAIDVAVGDRVDVNGTVSEFFGETQINVSSVAVTGTGMIQVTDVNLPATSVVANGDGITIADLERYEGMLVRFPQTLSVSSLRLLEQFGEVSLTQGGRPFQFTNTNAPDASAYSAHRDSLAARSLLLDDGKRSSNPENLVYLRAGPSSSYSIRVGDSVSGLSGNLRFSRGSGGNGEQRWRLMPTGAVIFSDSNPRPGAPSVSGSIRVASFNVLNFFSNIDAGQPNCGPANNQNCRGADSALELSRQTSKTVSALEMMAADVVGLIELENNASESISTLVDALNARVGSGRYAFVDTGAIDSDAIKTGFIYDSATVRSVGSFATLTSATDARFNDSRNRPALAQTFEVISNGAILTLVVNHLKSKGSPCDSDGDTNTGDGQGNCNMARTSAAVAIADWISTDPTNSGDDDYLIIGDLNAYLMEDPLTALSNAGLTNLLGANSDAYSFVFDEQSGALDHAIATLSLASQVSETIEWHINADEPKLLDYNLENGRDPSLFDAHSPYRASDHDPVIIGLSLTN